MKCAICRNGETQPGTVVLPLQRGETIVIIKGVPADVCDNCGEPYLSEAVTREVYSRAEGAIMSGTEVAIVHYAA